jgi:hypothetical protein
MKIGGSDPFDVGHLRSPFLISGRAVTISHVQRHIT